MFTCNCCIPRKHFIAHVLSRTTLPISKMYLNIRTDYYSKSTSVSIKLWLCTRACDANSHTHHTQRTIRSHSQKHIFCNGYSVIFFVRMLHTHIPYSRRQAHACDTRLRCKGFHAFIFARLPTRIDFTLTGAFCAKLGRNAESEGGCCHTVFRLQLRTFSTISDMMRSCV